MARAADAEQRSGPESVEPKRYIFLRRRRALGARLLGLAVSVVIVGLPAELERGVAAEPEAGMEGGPVRVAALDPQDVRPPARAAAPELAWRRRYGDGALRAFAASAAQMIAIRERWRPVLDRAAASGPEEAAKVRREQGLELAGAVRERGLTPARYREIFDAAQQDPALKSYLLSLVRTADAASAAD